MEDLLEITCANCGHVDYKKTNFNWECPLCKGKKATIAMKSLDGVPEVHDMLEGEIHNPTKRREQGKTGKSAKKPIKEFMDGDEYSDRLKKFVDKKREIDRESYMYYEKVTDKETSEIIHEVQETLTDHYGHGSDKFKKIKSP